MKPELDKVGLLGPVKSHNPLFSRSLAQSVPCAASTPVNATGPSGSTASHNWPRERLRCPSPRDSPFFTMKNFVVRPIHGGFLDSSWQDLPQRDKLTP